MEKTPAMKSKLLRCEEKCMDRCSEVEGSENYMKCVGDCMTDCATYEEAALLPPHRFSHG